MIARIYHASARYFLWTLLGMGWYLFCNAADYEFRLDILPPCIENNKNVVRVEGIEVVRMNQNRFWTNGTLFVDEIIEGDLELVLTTTRCSYDKNICEEFNVIRFDGICQKIRVGNAVMGGIMSAAVPKFTCPLKPGVYKWNNGTLDLDVVAKLPLTGYSWITSFTFYRKDLMNQTNKDLLFCFNVRSNLIKVNHLRQKKTRRH